MNYQIWLQVWKQLKAKIKAKKIKIILRNKKIVRQVWDLVNCINIEHYKYKVFNKE